MKLKHVLNHYLVSYIVFTMAGFFVVVCHVAVNIYVYILLFMMLIFLWSKLLEQDLGAKGYE